MAARKMKRGGKKARKGGFLGALAASVLPSILGPIANRIFGRKGEGRKRQRGRGGMKKKAGNLAAPYAGTQKRKSHTRGGAVLTPGPLA